MLPGHHKYLWIQGYDFLQHLNKLSIHLPKRTSLLFQQLILSLHFPPEIPIEPSHLRIDQFILRKTDYQLSER